MELISREEAMRLLKEDLNASRSRGDDERADACFLHYIEISNLPTIEERKEGRWIHESCSRLIDETDEGRVYTIEKRWYCSRCGFSKGFRMYRPDEKYCSNCGAKMKGE